ncbi:MAG: ABC transporter permease subunit, partial [Desulfitobacteriaceae bacterium]|nr:ABC transporter permease subunit [Desulfitobacteriaceae bacterium]
IVLPIVYTNMLQGIKSTDTKLLEMAELFRVGWFKKMKYIYLPELKPYLISACSVSIGLSWKAGIAAEVIGIPDGSIGEKLYEAKVYLSSGDLFAWTAVIIVVSIAFEKLSLYLLKWVFLRLERS